MFEVERPEMLGDISSKKINFGKGSNAKTIKGLQRLVFKFLSFSAGAIENVRHTLTLCLLSSYNLDSY